MTGRRWVPWSLVAGLLLLAAAATVWSASTAVPSAAPRRSGSNRTPLPSPRAAPPVATTVPAPVLPSTTLAPTPAAVAAVALARSGERLSYVATYDLTPIPADHGIDITTMTVGQVGNPAGGWPTQWYYRLGWADGAAFEMEVRPGGANGLVYRCGRQSPTAAWSCYGPTATLGGNYGHTLAEVYEPMTQAGFLQGTLADHGATSTTTSFGGQPVQCLTDGTSQTWCLTSSGVFASFPAEDDLGPYARGLVGRLVSWTGDASPLQFVLPATPSLAISPGSVCVQGGPC